MRNIARSFVFSDHLPIRIAKHILLFIIMNMLFIWVVSARNDYGNNLYTITKGVFINSLFFFGYAYLTAYWLIPVLLNAKKYMLFIVGFISAGVIISIVKFSVSEYIFYNVISEGPVLPQSRLNLQEIIVNTKDMTFIVALFLVVKYTKDNYHIQHRISELKEYRLLAEIKMLRNQLDPHVLFNNLNNIYCLSINRDQSVGQYLNSFGSILSYYFIDGSSEKVSLEKELNAIEAYLCLERLRYGDRLDLEYTVEGMPGGKTIYPFVFLSYIENCFTHGCGTESGDPWVKIYIRIEKDSVTFHASNSKPKSENSFRKKLSEGKSWHPGNLLEVIYPGQHLIRIDKRDRIYGVDLKLMI